MKGKGSTVHFKVPNTGKSPISVGANKHTPTGAMVPAAYAQQMSVTNKILNRVMHTRPTKKRGSR